MGCLGRFFWCMVYFGIAITCFFIWFLLSSLTSDAQKSASVSLLTPEKKLETVLREDGPAWVKGRIESLSSGSVLYCDGHPCIWYRFERQEKREEDIRKGGTWIKRKTWKRVLSDEKGVPAVFVAGSESFPIKDWLGIEISEDLLSGSNIISSQAEKAPHENSAESPEVLNASDSDESKNSQTIGKWLPAGM
ncbi:hypothetical protein HYY75_10525, partial [bacterium]|nr:hypothetical protein [bacterium]